MLQNKKYYAIISTMDKNVNFTTENSEEVLMGGGEEKEEQTASRDIKEQSKEAEKEVKEDKNLKSSDKKKIHKKEVIEFFKFVGFSISAGVIQLGSFELMYDLIKWRVWWACYLISIVLSVLWNFTFNRKFTFKSASNVPLAMTFAFLFYCAFTPASLFGGNALEGAGWNGTLVEAMMMVINFTLEFVWDKFVVFNDKLMSKISEKLKIGQKKENNKEENM